MIADVKRVYVPAVEWKRNTFQQASLADIQALSNINGKGQYPNICRVVIDPTLIHRKVWAWFWSISATWAASIALVGRLKGVQQFEHTIVKWTPQNATDKYVWNFQTSSTLTGSAGEQMFIVINNTTTFGCAPFRLNTGIDELYLRVDSLTGAAAAFDAGISVQSQQGI